MQGFGVCSSRVFWLGPQPSELHWRARVDFDSSAAQGRESMLNKGQLGRGGCTTHHLPRSSLSPKGPHPEAPRAPRGSKPKSSHHTLTLSRRADCWVLGVFLGVSKLQALSPKPCRASILHQETPHDLGFVGAL